MRSTIEIWPTRQSGMKPLKKLSILIVYAHPEPTSFSGALKDAAREVLEANGHDVTVSDLYASSFNPVGGRHDFRTVFDANRFHYQSEMKFASENNAFADDLRHEQEAILRADLLIVVFPLWWFGPPAILKGWFDRVCAGGVTGYGRTYSEGLFGGRRAVMCLPTGGTTERFSNSGSHGPIETFLHPIQHGVLSYLGYEAMPPFVAYAAPRVTADVRLQYLADWKRYLETMTSDSDWLGSLDEKKAEAQKSAFFERDTFWSAPR
jgi:NAD(P)H dehydrogenase (quinone)